MKEKIGIISDTHGLLRPEVLEILKDCKYILHAGDVNKDEILDVLRSMGNLYVVRGNNDKDWAENLRTSLSFTIGGVKFFMVHNKKDVAWELGDTQVVIFGHTHKYFEKMIDGRLWLNPGSCGRSRFGGEVTMAVMTVEDGKYQVEKIILAENSRKRSKPCLNILLCIFVSVVYWYTVMDKRIFCILLDTILVILDL